MDNVDIVDIAQTHFELFGLPSRFDIDRSQLDSAYRRVLSRAHPDRFAAAGAAEQRVALQWATRINEGYRTLSDEIGRARYLAELRGIGLEVETNTAMPPDFLMEQMELREALEEAVEGRDASALQGIEERLRSERAEALAEVARLFDAEGKMAESTSSEGAAAVATAQAVRKLMFLDRFGADLDQAIDHLDAMGGRDH